MSEMALLGANLHEAREYIGLSPRNGAEHLEISEQEISAMETGQRAGRDGELESLARLYRCSPSFLRGSEAMQVPTALVAAPGWDKLDFRRQGRGNPLRLFSPALRPPRKRGFMTTTIRDERLPLLRQGVPPIPALEKRSKVEVNEAKTQRPLIVQGANSFVSQFDETLATYSGCPYKCLYCYVPDILRGLAEKQGGWGNYLNIRSRSVELLSRHIEEVEGASIFLSATTDPYNPYEGKHGLTRRLLEVLAGSKMGFLLISTRGTLVERDIDLFTGDGLRGRVEIGISIQSDLLAVHSAIEPYAPAYARRFEVASKLKAAGIPVRIHAAPLALHSEEFYTMAGSCANWLWIDEPEHSAALDSALAPWFYTNVELQDLVRQAPLRPGLSPSCVGYGKRQFGWRWDSERQCIVPPPPRVKFPPEKRKGSRDG